MKLQSLVKDIILESDKRDSIQNILGFSQEWANEFHEINPKLSIWIANTFFNDFMKNYMVNIHNDLESGKINMAEAKKGIIKFLNEKKTNYYYWKTVYRPGYNYIMDWLTSPRRPGKIDIKSLSFRDALEMATEWHESLDSNAVINYEEKNEILIDYRNKSGIGYYWVNLKTDFSEEEKYRMGHCGRDSGCTLFSLRSLNEFGESKSHITASYRPNERRLDQIKGRKNSKPKEQYYKYIIDLINNEKYPVESLYTKIYKPLDNFLLSDLSDVELNTLFSKNKTLKINYYTKNKIKLAVNNENNDIFLLQNDDSLGYYGIINAQTLEIIKDFEYVLDPNSDYSHFLYSKKYSKQLTLKHFFNANNNDEFIIASTKGKFDIITKEIADKMMESNDWEFFGSSELLKESDEMGQE
jgi:hypothetical protein